MIKKNTILAGVMAVCLLLTGCQGSTKAGKAYLKSLDEKDASVLARSMDEQIQAEMFSKYENGEVDTAAALQDTIVMGDSRVVAASDYGYLTDSEVLADIGVDSKVIPDYAKSLASIQPLNIVWAFGLNDMMHRLGNEEENGYKEYIGEVMDTVVQTSPDSKIFISSILPASDESEEQFASIANPDFYNDQLKALCEEKGWTYIDNSALPFDDYYEGDGQHFTSDFYGMWLDNVIKAIMNASQSTQTDTEDNKS